jgi:hypothetical protein
MDVALAVSHAEIIGPQKIQHPRISAFAEMTIC